MSYVGRWHFHSIGSFDSEDGLTYLSAEEYLASPMLYIDESDEEAVEDELRERRNMVGMQVEVLENKTLYMLMPLPEGATDEEINEAVKEGAITLYDGMITQAPMAWEERNGELWYDSGIEGTVYGEKADSWAKAVGADGYFNFMNIRFKKAE